MEQEPLHLVKARKDLQAEAHNNYNLLLQRWCRVFSFFVMTVEARYLAYQRTVCLTD